MKRRRRCGVCDELFAAEPRVGDRQRTCGSDGCKAEWHRQTCKEWRDGNPASVQAYRLRTRLGSPELNREVVREALGAKVSVVLEEVFRLTAKGSREAFAAKQLELSPESFRLAPRVRREATDTSRRPP